MGVTIPGPSGEVLELFEISNSLRLNQGDSPVLTKTFSSAGTEETFTWSGWVKRGSDFGTRQVFFGADNAENNNASYIRFTDDETIQAYLDDGNSLESNLNTSAKFRDVSAWYHIVWAVDTTQGTDTNRVKIYVNGVQLTDFQSPVYPPQNFVTDINAANEPHYVATPTAGVGNDYALDGYITEVNFVDGSQLTPTSFGEFDDNGVWIPKRYTGSYGTNGFFLQFKQTGTSQNSSGIGADTSGQDNHFAVTNLAATDITEDTCQNNFCTLNPLYKQGSPTFSEGNCKVVLPAGDGTQGAAGGIAPANGKWYWEVKHVSSTNSSILVREASDKEDDISYFEGNYAGYEKLDGNQRVTGNTESTYGAAYGNGDILMVALDMDNDRVYFGKNGSWNDGSGNADEANLSDYVSLSGVVNGLAAVANGNGSATATFEFNFGNAPYAISSGNTDGKYGNFEYAVPSGYYALCTKRLTEFG